MATRFSIRSAGKRAVALAAGGAALALVCVLLPFDSASATDYDWHDVDAYVDPIPGTPEPDPASDSMLYPDWLSAGHFNETETKVSYRLHPDGSVRMRGAVFTGGAPTNTEWNGDGACDGGELVPPITAAPIFRLPEGYRPARQAFLSLSLAPFGATGTSPVTVAAGMVVVQPNGEVVVISNDPDMVMDGTMRGGVILDVEFDLVTSHLPSTTTTEPSTTTEPPTTTEPEEEEDPCP